ncbi:MAG TPA: metallophosphoesterase [archaeon]|nr:metallophosphoesterase [archaeon]
MTKTRIFFVSDIHGSDRLFLKFVNAGKVYKANILLLGGDITGKTVTPVLNEGNHWLAEYVGTKQEAHTEEQLAELERRIRDIGSYPYRTTAAEWETLRQNAQKMDEIFTDLMTNSLRRWIQIAEERLKPIGVKIIINIGNDDLPIVGETLKSSGYVIYPNEQVISLDDKHEMPSVGYSNKTPWDCPGDISEEELLSKLEKTTEKLVRPENSLFNFHCPPYDTQIDLAPRLDNDLKPVLTPGGEPEMAHVGSTSVRQVIEKFQPLAGLHGHIHEARGFSQVGKTICFNPGSEYTTGVLRGLVVNLSDKKIDNYVFTEG